MLIADSPSKWPSPYDGHRITFAEFKTVDAQDLIRFHDTIAESRLSQEFVNRFKDLRTKRNTISHSIDKHLQVHTTEVIETILFLHKALFSDKNWAKIRADFIERYPDVALGSEFSRNRACRELEVLFELLSHADVQRFFGVDTKERLYMCPACMDAASRDQEFDHKLAMLRPNGSTSMSLYCPICDAEHTVVRRDCGQDGCQGNVLSRGENQCLTCGRYCEEDSEDE